MKFHNYTYGRNMLALWEKLRIFVSSVIEKHYLIDSDVNYLQDYYQCFVPNKPSCLCKPLPLTIEELNAYTEEHLVQA